MRWGAADSSAPTILILGTSLTLGYGVPASQSYPSLLQGKLDSVGLRYQVVARGVPGERSDGVLKRFAAYAGFPVALLVLEIGANDARAGTEPDVIRRNIELALDSAARIWPDARMIVAGISGPPSQQDDYGIALRDEFVRAAQARGTTLLPNLLQGVVGRPEFNQPDGVHPTARGHGVMAQNIWPVLEQVLRARAPD
ncbi:MAG TPA: GDSL-type esterase/lipase family protein [Gemmatimonadales bacterium]|nr:GDSL-type esterase/lipase family protein [Gemmatimonadales bacterium]